MLSACADNKVATDIEADVPRPSFEDRLRTDMSEGKLISLSHIVMLARDLGPHLSFMSELELENCDAVTTMVREWQINPDGENIPIYLDQVPGGKGIRDYEFMTMLAVGMGYARDAKLSGKPIKPFSRMERQTLKEAGGLSEIFNPKDLSLECPDLTNRKATDARAFLAYFCYYFHEDIPVRGYQPTVTHGDMETQWRGCAKIGLEYLRTGGVTEKVYVDE